MTRQLHHNERDRIIDDATETLARVRAFKEGIRTLRQAISDRLEDGMRAQTYDGDGRGTTTTSTTERAALDRADQAHDDLARLDAVLVNLADADQGLVTLMSRYPIWAGKPRAQKPGEGPCPVGSCKNCWSFKRDEPAGEKWKDSCDICGRWKADHGERMIEPLWDLRVRQGKARVTTADLRKHARHLLPEDDRKAG